MAVIIGVAIIVVLGVGLFTLLAVDLKKAKRGEKSRYWREKK